MHVIKSPYNTVLTSQLLGDTLGFLLHKGVYLMENPVYIVNKMSKFSPGPIKSSEHILFTKGYLKDRNAAAQPVDSDIFYAVIH